MAWRGDGGGDYTLLWCRPGYWPRTTAIRTVFMSESSGESLPTAMPDGAARRTWQALALAEVMAALASRPEGLSGAEVAARREKYGANVLPSPRPPHLLAVYLRQFKSPLIYLLVAAAVVSLVIGEIADAAFIVAVLQVNAIIGTFQEWRAGTKAEALRSTVRTWATAMRDGVRRQVSSEDLVPGDIVFVESGLRVPADIRLISGHELDADESLLTGESMSVAKDADALVEATAIGDRRNMLHAGTTVLSGRGSGVVTQIGRGTEIGRIAQALSAGESAPTPLIVRMREFARFLAVVSVALIAAMVAIELARGMPPAEIFLVAVALAVSVIPEGLPVALTVALSIAVSRMAARGVVVRQLPAVEGLGACTLVASDKTGTLTVNELTVRALYVPALGRIEMAGEGYHPEGGLTQAGQPLDAAAADDVKRLAITAALCNEADFRDEPDGGHGHFGDSVDVALLVLARKLDLRRDTLLALYPQADVIPFESHRRFAAAFHRDGEAVVAHVKGAAETVVPMCAGIDTAAALAIGDALAAEGYRVLAVASGEVPARPTAADLRGLRFLGLVAMIDPLRPEARDAVARCREAGVDVRMITGDHPITALAIARELGLAREAAEVVTGSDLRACEEAPEKMDALVHRARVFARIEPLQKLALVEAMLRAGHFVAVTGDGVNDAPALNRANIGVAMGRKGTDVARAAADLIITDDNFASIVAGIEEGRIAYDNVRKVIYLLISTGAAEIVLFLLAVATALPLPLSAVQLLWLNLVTNGIQDVALAFERGEPGVLERRPRPPRQGILDRRMVEQVALSGVFGGGIAFALFAWCLDVGLSGFEASNATLLFMVFFENAHTFNCRSETRSVFRTPLRNNPFLILAVLGAQAIHILAMYTPGLSEVLDVAPLAPALWIPIAAVAASVVLVMELYKLGSRGRDNRRGSRPGVRAPRA